MVDSQISFASVIVYVKRWKCLLMSMQFNFNVFSVCRSSVLRRLIIGLSETPVTPISLNKMFVLLDFREMKLKIYQL